MKPILKVSVIWALGLAVLGGSAAASFALPIKDKKTACRCACAYKDAEGKRKIDTFDFSMGSGYDCSLGDGKRCTHINADGSTTGGNLNACTARDTGQSGKKDAANRPGKTGGVKRDDPPAPDVRTGEKTPLAPAAGKLPASR